MKNRRFSMIMALVFLFSAIAPGLALAAELTPDMAAEAVQEEFDGAFRGEDTAAEAKPAVTPSAEGSIEEAGRASGSEAAETAVQEEETEDLADLLDFIPSIDKDSEAFQVEVSGGTVGPFLNPYKIAANLGDGTVHDEFVIFPEPVVVRNNSGFDIQVDVTMTVIVPADSRVETVQEPADLAEPAIRMFSWFEFVPGAGKTAAWSGKYTGAANQIKNGETKQGYITIPDGGAVCGMLFGRFSYPLDGMWSGSDMADFSLHFVYHPAPGVEMGTPVAAPAGPSAPERTPAKADTPVIPVTEEPAAEPAETVTEEPAAEPAETVTEEPTVESAEDVTEEPAAEPAEDVTEEPAAEPAEDVTEEPAAESAEAVPEEPGAESAEAVTEEATGETETAEPLIAYGDWPPAPAAAPETAEGVG